MREKGKKLTDTAWTCSCGSLNTGYRKTCGSCKKTKHGI
jgi:hypothetical protein